ncbi:relaxase/mobilization nuclease domain-containing protein [Chitinophaga sp. XS-30]|uniref:relaxase/mobilization nuclease domain-containing protein n=1 Tax=Chitinophaga sp. XS-30 TaxID=2604421 RepID=UPI0011DE3088|nr:relaxase/mobilization nuclease domain-containing protein [Chitinophaga sp. XS-30]QEH39463.1 relaxase/mobilization nuclease domain-containing protein [Chitinophaga sp. XS-30]
MVVRFKSGKSLRGALIYNERKLDRGEAVLLTAVGFHKDADRLNFLDKLKRLERLAEKRSTVRHKCVHVSLNFSPRETLSPDRLKVIAADYLERIGFRGQPYLLYEHRDAGHQHVHLVTTPIQANGERIDLHHLVERESEPARKAIERTYNLVRAEDQKAEELAVLRPADLKKALYGKAETKGEISRIVRTVANYYKYKTFEQYNAVLRQFNVEADPGEPGTRMHRHGGLLYRMLDQGGNRIGNAIKASSIYDEPTLTFLQEKYLVNKRFYTDYSRVRCALEDALSVGEITPERFREKLSKLHIDTLYYTTKEGGIFGITFIDHQTQSVFKASAMGPQYTAEKLLDRMQVTPVSKELAWNRLFVQEVLRQTDYSKGFKQVLAAWSQLGLVVTTQSDTNGRMQFRLGHINSPPDQVVSAPDRMHAYLRQHIVSASMINQFSDHLRCSGHVPLVAPMQTALSTLDRLVTNMDVEVTEKIFSLFDQADGYARTNSFVDPELLKEAKKKRRKRRL